jgi:hypothetical protein
MITQNLKETSTNRDQSTLQAAMPTDGEAKSNRAAHQAGEAVGKRAAQPDKRTTIHYPLPLYRVVPSTSARSAFPFNTSKELTRCQLGQ